MIKLPIDPRLPDVKTDGGYLQRLVSRLYELLRTMSYSINSVHDGWDDLRFPSQGINPPGAASDPTVNSTTGLLTFSGTADNVVAGVAQMPHAWKRGSAIRPHIHLRFINAGTRDTRWKFEYDIASVNDDFANAYGTYTAMPTITVTNPNNAKTHVIAGFGDIEMTTHRESCVILWRLSRLAASDTADTDTKACVLMEFDIHFQTEKAGTPNELPS